MVNVFPCLPPRAAVTARQMPKGLELGGYRSVLESLFELWAAFHNVRCD